MSILKTLTDKFHEAEDSVKIKESELEAKGNVPSDEILDTINQDPEGAPDNFDPEAKEGK